MNQDYTVDFFQSQKTSSHIGRFAIIYDLKKNCTLTSPWTQKLCWTFFFLRGGKNVGKKYKKNIDLKYSPTWFIEILLYVSALLIQFSFPRDDLLINSFSWMLCSTTAIREASWEVAVGSLIIVILLSDDKQWSRKTCSGTLLLTTAVMQFYPEQLTKLLMSASVSSINKTIIITIML